MESTLAYTCLMSLYVIIIHLPTHTRASEDIRKIPPPVDGVFSRWSLLLAVRDELADGHPDDIGEGVVRTHLGPDLLRLRPQAAVADEPPYSTCRVLAQVGTVDCPVVPRDSCSGGPLSADRAHLGNAWIQSARLPGASREPPCPPCYDGARARGARVAPTGVGGAPAGPGASDRFTLVGEPASVYDCFCASSHCRRAWRTAAETVTPWFCAACSSSRRRSGVTWMLGSRADRPRLRFLGGGGFPSSTARTLAGGRGRGPVLSRRRVRRLALPRCADLC